MSLYEDLGIGPDATPEEITAAYRRAARQHHPDAGGQDEDFARVQHAAMVLRDPTKREKYDRTGDESDEPDNHWSHVAQTLCQAFEAVLTAKLDTATVDFIDGARATLREEATLVIDQKRTVMAAQSYLNKCLVRLKHKGDGPNVIAGMLNAKIEDGVRMMKVLEDRQAVLRDAIEMAADFDWTTDPKPPAPPRSSGIFFTSDTTTV